MTAAQFMQEFLKDEAPHRALLVKVRNQRKEMGPVFVDLVTRLAQQPIREMNKHEVQVLMPILFMLAEWREPFAYRPVARLFRRPTAIVEHLIHDHITDNSFRILASLFDGDLTPLIEGACDPRADDFVRGSFMSALVLTSLAHPELRNDVEKFFRRFRSYCPEAPDEVMISWMESITDLGMEDMAEAVREAMQKEEIPKYHTDFSTFEAKLRETIDGNGVPSSARYRKFLISDAVGELFR